MKKDQLPGRGYFAHLSAQEADIYRRYNNVIEGVRTVGSFHCPHPVSRVPAPVPNVHETDSLGNWHYCSLDQLPTEFSDVSHREVDDFRPVVRLNALIKSQGEPNLHTYKDTKGNLCTSDTNQAWQKIVAALQKFVKKFTGLDLEEVTARMAENIYILLLKKMTKKKLEKMNIKLSRKNLRALQTGLLKVKIVRNAGGHRKY